MHSSEVELLFIYNYIVKKNSEYNYCQIDLGSAQQPLHIADIDCTELSKTWYELISLLKISDPYF